MRARRTKYIFACLQHRRLRRVRARRNDGFQMKSRVAADGRERAVLILVADNIRTQHPAHSLLVIWLQKMAEGRDVLLSEATDIQQRCVKKESLYVPQDKPWKFSE